MFLNLVLTFGMSALLLYFLIWLQMTPYSPQPYNGLMKIWINIQTTQSHNRPLYITATSTIPMRYIIEHLEEKLYPWCLLEYTHISKMVGKDKDRKSTRLNSSH